MRNVAAAASLGALCFFFAGCGGDGHPPTARIAFSPEYVPAGDAYATDVTLDGTASRDDVDDPAGALPLTFQWEIGDPKPRVIAGALDAAKLTVRLAATGPTTVRLTVTGSGGVGRASVRVGVTVPSGS